MVLGESVAGPAAAASHPNLSSSGCDLGDVETNAHLFKYDSVHGRFQDR